MPSDQNIEDGPTPKRRGPKPDSKPALTRRQELNRQAQRTHRERKEMYIKALEQEVLRLKEVFATATKERDAVNEENRKLRDLLAAHGIQYDSTAVPIKFQREESGYGPSSSGSISGSYAPGSDSTDFSPPPLAPAHPNGNGVSRNAPSHMQSMAQLPSGRLDYDQIGIDFVLTLERPCMNHMQYLLVRSHNAENLTFHHPQETPDDGEHEHMSGHALMATAPPHSHIMGRPSEIYPCQMPADLGTEGLAKLLDLSNRLPFDHYSEITPVMAWTTILRHPHVNRLELADFEAVKTDLVGKVRCYGFGAVVEEFELHDALEAVWAKKDAAPVLHE
ncbi:hypothetical protein LTR32_000070 [Rachicladosporium monterosium]|uniref:BZIP domain-containing protein n=1 Tax=Rachicladosporium monterosium TaxID=1507873 RepID=A0ABR0LH85_9PEZI|nr:hypothetical protein LTR32_000070 [Rachicladosporium monterosium]